MYLLYRIISYIPSSTVEFKNGAEKCFSFPFNSIHNSSSYFSSGLKDEMRYFIFKFRIRIRSGSGQDMYSPPNRHTTTPSTGNKTFTTA
jgi:hypothetical protein